MDFIDGYNHNLFDFDKNDRAFPIGPEKFIKLIKEIKNNTVIRQDRCLVLYQLLHLLVGTKGAVAEVGVYKGGSAKLISKTISQYKKKLYIFDTFSGMPPVDEEKDNTHLEGEFNVSLTEVQKYLEDCSNVIIHPGFFPDTTNAILDIPFSFVHIDVDIYQSTVDCCEFFYPRMSKNGIMLFDDYGFESCLGCRKAVDEFFEDKPEYIIHLHTEQCLIIKL